VQALILIAVFLLSFFLLQNNMPTTSTYNFLQAISTNNPLYIFSCTKSSLKYKGKHSEIFNATIQTPESILSCEKENLYAPMLSTADAIPLFQQSDVHKSLSPLSVVCEHHHVIWVTCINETKQIERLCKICEKH